MKRLRWKKKPKLTGLARVCAGPQGSEYHDGEKQYASVDCLRRVGGSWYWVAGWGSGIPHFNSCSDPVRTEEEAKKQAEEYVKSHISIP